MPSRSASFYSLSSHSPQLHQHCAAEKSNPEKITRREKLRPFQTARDQTPPPENMLLQSLRELGPLLSKWVQNTPTNFKTGALDHSAANRATTPGGRDHDPLPKFSVGIILPSRLRLILRLIHCRPLSRVERSGTSALPQTCWVSIERRSQTPAGSPRF